MCGIGGELRFGNSGQVNERGLTAMSKSLVHRGPDGDGLWIGPDRNIGLVHRRLAIVDLTHAAAQPMSNEDKSVWVSFNGEIYNHSKLRTELVGFGHRFVTDHSDTEVIVHGYEQWGLNGLVQRLSGDFAIALWSQTENTLHLIRDRIGVKPLYFAFVPGGVLFASEIRAILARDNVSTNLNAAALNHYLTFMSVPAPLTMFEGVHKLPAGFHMSINSMGLSKILRYWDAVPIGSRFGQDCKHTKLKKNELVEHVRQKFTDAVADRSDSDAKQGVFLSGGVDSSAIVATLASQSHEPIQTFTVGYSDYQENNELVPAHRIAERFATQHHEVVIDSVDMMNYLGALTKTQDEPIADWVCIPLYFVSKLARDSGVKVVHVGEGSDEQFVGYQHYFTYEKVYRYFFRALAVAPKWLKRALLRGSDVVSKCGSSFDQHVEFLRRAALGQELFWGGASVFLNSQKSRLVTDALIDRIRAQKSQLNLSDFSANNALSPDTYDVVRDIYAVYGRSNFNGGFFARLAYNELKLRLPELLLMRVDKVTMSTSVEARVPFLDHRLVEFTMNLCDSQRVGYGESKYLLKQALTNLLPTETLAAKKSGFQAPMDKWLRGEFGRYAESRINSSRLISNGYLNSPYIKGLFDAHRRGTDLAAKIWTLFNLVEWEAHWIG
ncbi:MAG: asparagine synthase (glutamine-hydrolyzing) [Steroidobacteraceae bacterium]